MKLMIAELILGRVLLDTNVLIYASLGNDPRHQQALEVLELRHSPEVEMFISVQNLAEMYPNLTGPKNQPPDRPEIARDKITAFSTLHGVTVLPVTNEVIQRALELCVIGKVTRQNYFDRQLAALMQCERIPLIVTENTKDFVGISGIEAVNPFV